MSTPLNWQNMGVMGGVAAALTPADLQPARNVETEVPLVNGSGNPTEINARVGDKVNFFWGASGWRSDWTLRLTVGTESFPFNPTAANGDAEMLSVTPTVGGKVRVYITRTNSSTRTFLAAKFLLGVIRP